jgi:hypothetical protein
MKTNSLIALVSAAAVGIAFVLSFEAGVSVFVLIGITAIAVADYGRIRRPLMVRLDPVAVRASHDLRLAV